jgi:hypothetical protein
MRRLAPSESDLPQPMRAAQACAIVALRCWVVGQFEITLNVILSIATSGRRIFSCRTGRFLAAEVRMLGMTRPKR